MRRSTLFAVCSVPCLFLASCGPERTTTVSAEPTQVRSQGVQALTVGDSVGHMAYSSRSARLSRGAYVDQPIATVPDNR